MDEDRPEPVFVDPSGRRRRTVRALSVFGAAAALSAAGLLTATLLGAPLGPLASLPDPPPTGSSTPSAPPTDRPSPTTGQLPATTTDQPSPVQTTDQRSTPPPPSSSHPGNSTPSGPKTTTSKPGNGHGRPTTLPTPPSHTH